VIQAAGIEPSYRSILGWLPSTTEPPDAPTKVTVLYAYKSLALVTWHDSFGQGSSPVTSYTVSACPVPHGNNPNACASAGPSTTIKPGVFALKGYVTIHGLVAGQRYSFSVTATSAAGNGPPSVASGIVRAGSIRPSYSLPVSSFNLEADHGNVRVSWYPPRSALSPMVFTRRSVRRAWFRTWIPVLWYVLTCSNGKKYIEGGHNRLIVTNHGGRGLAVIPGLRSGHSYTFSIVAVTPKGKSGAVRAKVRMP